MVDQLAYYRTVSLPVEIHESDIVEEVTQVTFRAIADRLNALGFPVTGDFGPGEVDAIENAVESFIAAMALNNGDIGKMNDGENNSGGLAVGYEATARVRGVAEKTRVLGYGDAELRTDRRTLTVVFDVTDLDEHEIQNLETEAVVQGERSKDEYVRDDGKPSGHRDVPVLATRVSEPHTALAHAAHALTPGTRVRLRRDVERFPHFIAPKGATGTVVDNGSPDVFAVYLDETLPGAEEWKNEVHWIAGYHGDDVAADVEVIGQDEAELHEVSETTEAGAEGNPRVPEFFGVVVYGEPKDPDEPHVEFDDYTPLVAGFGPCGSREEAMAVGRHAGYLEGEWTVIPFRPVPIVGRKYVDGSHPDEPVFTVTAYAEDEGIVELDNGQWYELNGDDGLLAKLAAGIVRPV